MSMWSRVLAGVMAVLFFFSVYLQTNDPDPERWIAIYGAAGLVCALHAFGRGPAWLAGLVAAVALAWALVWAPRVVGKTRLSDMVAEWKMTRGDVRAEEGRELGGLVAIALTCGVVTVARRRRRTV